DWATALAGPFKAVWASRFVDARMAPRLLGHAFVGTPSQHVNSLPWDYRLPLAISAVDTAVARMQIQDTLPRRIVNAGIAGTGVEVSVHGFGDEGPSLACLGLQEQLESWSAKPD